MQGISPEGPPLEEIGIIIASAAVPLVIIFAFGASPRLLLPLEIFVIWVSAYPALRRLAPATIGGLRFWRYFIKGLLISLSVLIAIHLTDVIFPN
jgi:hypothetical protein